MDKKIVIKAAVLALFMGVAIVTVRFTPVKDSLTPAHIGALLETAGIWAPVVIFSSTPSVRVSSFPAHCSR